MRSYRRAAEPYAALGEQMQTGLFADDSYAMLTFGGLSDVLFYAENVGIGWKVETSLGTVYSG
jgi:hypothetical protein